MTFCINLIYNRNKKVHAKNVAKLDWVDVGDGYPTRIMAVLNLSPEAFYKASVAVGDAVERALELEKHADILDVVAMSTAPYLDTWIRPKRSWKE